MIASLENLKTIHRKIDLQNRHWIAESESKYKNRIRNRQWIAESKSKCKNKIRNRHWIAWKQNQKQTLNCMV